MGQFSWLDCITGEQVVDMRPRKSYVLVPQQFGGGHIEEECYEGYGVFGGHDVYDLVTDWNKDEITYPEEPKREQWQSGKDGDIWYEHAMKMWKRKCAIIEDFQEGTKKETMDWLYGKDWKRLIGIDIACHDKDNASLRYPIKITHDPTAVYEWCAPSKSDPNQGWAEDEWWDDYDNEEEW